MHLDFNKCNMCNKYVSTFIMHHTRSSGRLSNFCLRDDVVGR
jgi:hypothetical protein